jgi:nucleotide-binding universal stress UspA family protein
MKTAPDTEAYAPFKTVFAATDFSRGGALALRRAVRLPFARSAALYIAHVLPTELPAKFRTQIRTDAKRRLEEAAEEARAALQRITSSRVTVRTRLLSGQPFVEVIRGARSNKAELVVVGRYGERTLRKALIGSTAERVIRKADLPVLVVTGEARQRYGKPLVATDLQDASTGIVELALRAVGPKVDPVAIVYAYHLPFENRLGAGSSEAARDFRRHYEQDAERKMRKLLSAFRDAPVGFKAVLRKGDPRSVVLYEAEQLKADLIVVGTHGRTGIRRLLVGSVAEWVVRQARGDVLIASPVRVSFELP